MNNTQLAKTMKEAVIFKNLRNEPIISALAELLCCDKTDGDRSFSLCCEIARELYPYGTNLTDRVLALVCADENFLIEAIAGEEIVSAAIEQQLIRELRAFELASAYSSSYFVDNIRPSGDVPIWYANEADFVYSYNEYASAAAQRGYGIFASNHVFTVSEDGTLAPVKNPDPQAISELYGYESERELVLANTRSLLGGLPANNVLLYGDAGTGKSSTVKAIANAYKDAGLRLIQAEKGLLRHIPALLDYLASKPLKFIIFIDDLSFESNDRDFTALKTVLEGSVAARAKNTVIYATSNRRHLLRESFKARHGDDIHVGDTLEESSSLAGRFGIVVTFVRPDRDEYADLVLNLAEEYGLKLSGEDLISGAEAYAIRAGGRSPRVAKQYVEYKIAIK